MSEDEVTGSTKPKTVCDEDAEEPPTEAAGDDDDDDV